MYKKIMEIDIPSHFEIGGTSMDESGRMGRTETLPSICNISL